MTQRTPPTSMTTAPTSTMRIRPIPTWLHGCIDYGVAGLFGAAANSTTLSPAVRRTFGLLGAFHASYASVTDYECGVRPWLTMRQHLALDTIGASTLCVAGATLGDASKRERVLLIGSGLAELGIIALSRAEPTHDPVLAQSVDVSYPPLDTLKPIADGVFVVDSILPGLLGKMLPVRMTVVQLPDGELLLHSPTRFTEALRAELLRIGPVKHLVAPNGAHWTLLQQWQWAFPSATTWAAPGLRQRRAVRRSGVRIDQDLGQHAPDAWGGAMALIMVPGGFGFHEAVLFHHASRTAVLTDLVLNLEAGKIPPLVRPLVRLFGSTAPDGMPPPYVRLLFRMGGAAARTAVETLLSLAPQRAVFAHGRWFERDATQRLRRSFRWLLS